MIRRIFFAAFCLASALAGGPQLTTVQDVLYKADGTRFNGILTIGWSSFQSADSAAIVTQSITVKVIAGNLRVQLVPSPTTPPSYYTVVYNSDGRVQFQETWSVPSSTQAVRVRDVRVSTGASNAADTSGSSSGPVQESDVVGLVADLGARPLKGSSFAAGRVAFINALGALDAVSGNATDCLHVDGSSGTCGSSSGSFVDGDSPSGIVDGSNTAFTLSATPSPSSSLAVYRNGMLQKVGQDYTASGNTVQFVAADAPQPGDTLLASFRQSSGVSTSSSQNEPIPQVICSGSGASTAATTLTSIGACAIPPGLLLAGDRVEIHFDLAHTGAESGFTFEADWGATPILNRSGAPADAMVTARVDAAVVASGAQLSSQSWGSSLPFNATITASTDAYGSGLTVNFRGELGQAGDTLTLLNYTVVRLP